MTENWRQKLKRENPEKYEQYLEKQRAYMRTYRKEHAQQIRISKRKCRQKKPKQYRQMDRQYADAHREKIRENSRRHYSQHKEELAKKLKLHRIENPKQAKVYNKLSHKKMPECGCELCPEEDVSPATQRHHPDYDYPFIFVYVCAQCHAWVEKTKI